MKAITLPYRPGPALPRGGFTLIEVVVTLAVFILLTASVFGIMTEVFQSSNDIKANQNRRDEVSAFREYLKNSLGSLSADDRIISYRRGNGDGLGINGIILQIQGGTRAIDTTAQDNGLYRLRLARPTDYDPNPSLNSFSEELDRNTSVLNWVPLIRDVQAVQWKFRALGAPDWQTEWTQDSKMPDLIECSIQVAGDALPTLMDFQIPRLTPPGTATQQPVATNVH